MRAKLEACIAFGLLSFLVAVVISMGIDEDLIQIDSIEEPHTVQPPSWIDMPQISADILEAQTLERLLLFRAGRSESSMSFGSDEVMVLLNKILPGLLPIGVEQVGVSIDEGVAVLQALIVTRDWEGDSSFGSLFSVLPDTLSGKIEGVLWGTGRRLVLKVTGAWIHDISLPPPLVDLLIQQISKTPNVPGDRRLEVTLPPEIAEVRVDGNKVILFLAEPILDRAVDVDG